jgi:hypothetical protein
MPHGTGEDSDELLFQNFVSRLGQICDSRPRGNTVTAFVVLQRPDKVEYVFGSNRRTCVELETTRGYIGAILTSLRQSSDCEDDDQRAEYLSKLLREVLNFNRERIRSYLNGLTDALEACIASCETGSSLNGESKFCPLFNIPFLMSTRFKLYLNRKSLLKFWNWFGVPIRLTTTTMNVSFTNHPNSRSQSPRLT